MRPMMVASPATPTMALMRTLARPVMVMQPAIMPAIPQAQATVMTDFAPAMRAS